MKSKRSQSSSNATDGSELVSLWYEIFQKSSEIGQTFISSRVRLKNEEINDELGLGKAFSNLSEKLLSDPEKFTKSTTQFWEKQIALWQNWVCNGGIATTNKASVPDPRFKSELWNLWLFDYIKNAYWVTAEHIQKTVEDVESLDQTTARKVRFFTKQYVDAISPSNFALLNPDVLSATMDSGGKNLLDGLTNLLRDLKRGNGELTIKMVDSEAFTLGRDVATTSGRVIYQNELMQLIQYAPTTKQVNDTPLLIIPPWINKYYILDLRPKNSFIKWALDQGHTVFVISWVNPSKKHIDKTFDDYLLEGPLEALDQIEKICKTKTTNVVGYCLGGTLTAVLLGWLRASRQTRRVKSATFLASMIDFEDPGELGVFVDKDGIEVLEKRMEKRGYLEGSEMASTFNLLRSNDLIWSFVVNNYLLGKEPIPFDLLFWNSDATRMPAKMHSFYLRNMYIHNRLREPGGIKVAGRSIDLSKVTTPVCFVSTIDDHIAPWKSTFAGAKLFGGDSRFILGGSGHIAGIVNPPNANKYCYWTNEELSHSAETWLSTARKHEGSWWNDWNEWAGRFGGAQSKPRKISLSSRRSLEDAPGSYAKLRLDTMNKSPQKIKSKRRPSSKK